MFTPCTLCLLLLFFIVIKALSVCFGRERCQSSCTATSHIAFCSHSLCFREREVSRESWSFGGGEILFIVLKIIFVFYFKGVFLSTLPLDFKASEKSISVGLNTMQISPPSVVGSISLGSSYCWHKEMWVRKRFNWPMCAHVYGYVCINVHIWCNQLPLPMAAQASDLGDGMKEKKHDRC